MGDLLSSGPGDAGLPAGAGPFDPRAFPGGGDGSGVGPDGVDQLADAVDLDGDRVARTQKHGRFPRDAHALGRARDDDRAGQDVIWCDR